MSLSARRASSASASAARLSAAWHWHSCHSSRASIVAREASAASLGEMSMRFPPHPGRDRSPLGSPATESAVASQVQWCASTNEDWRPEKGAGPRQGGG
eukprot:3977808-Alexandrium_andersonii.AAC.1